MEDQHVQVEEQALFQPVDDGSTDQPVTDAEAVQQSPPLVTTNQHSLVVAATTVPATTTTAAKPDPEDCYDLQRCTVCLGIQFYPPQQPGQPRRVVLSIQNGATNKADLPLLAITTEEELGPLPGVLLDLWARLEADLPLRKQRDEERTAKAAAAKPAITVTSGRKAAKVPTAKPVTPPLPPTTSKPIEKEGLGMSGLFDAPVE